MVVKRTIALEIAGTKFRLVSDAEQQHLQELAAMINERVEKLSRAGARTASWASFWPCARSSWPMNYAAHTLASRRSTG